MSKGNVFMGMSRGKIGDIVLTRLAGEQVARARNRAPKNPRTTKQMAQRAALATIVEFYTRGVKNLFKFAFESKSAKESDYNAFVKANMGIVPVQSHKSLMENRSVFGPFIMSQGSLNAPAYVFDNDNSNGALLVNPIPTTGDQLTIGQLSQAIIEKNGLQDGDIITIVAVVASGDVVNITLQSAIEEGALQNENVPQKWTIRQFTLDTTSSVLVSALGIFELDGVNTKEVMLPFASNAFEDLSYDDGWSAAITVIASRNTPQGVKVSTSQLSLGLQTAQGSAIGLSDDWKRYVARHWNDSTSLNTDPENILEGSLSVNK